MTYQYLSHHERYQIAALMKAGQNQTQITAILGRHKSTIGREIARNQGQRGYRPRQAGLLAEARSQGSRNARKIDPEVLRAAFKLVGQQWSPEQVAARLPVSHETLYRHIYWDRAAGGPLAIAAVPEKETQALHGSGRDRRGQIPNRRPISTRPAGRRDPLPDWPLGGGRHSDRSRPQTGHCVPGGAKVRSANPGHSTST